jgi:hypothetical protein
MTIAAHGLIHCAFDPGSQAVVFLKRKLLIGRRTMATDIDTLIREIRSLPPDEQRRLQRVLAEGAPDNNQSSPSADKITDENYQQRLVDAGLLKHVKPRRRDQQAFDSFRPVEISGKPLSETIIEERR